MAVILDNRALKCANRLLVFLLGTAGWDDDDDGYALVYQYIFGLCMVFHS